MGKTDASHDAYPDSQVADCTFVVCCCEHISGAGGDEAALL